MSFRFEMIPSAPSSQSCRNSHGPYCPSTWSEYHSRRALQELLKPVSALAERVISEILPIAFEETEPDQARLLAALLVRSRLKSGLPSSLRHTTLPFRVTLRSCFTAATICGNAA
jgi:hypothetical protein